MADESASELIDPGDSLDEVAAAAEGCTACELYEDATQVVFGTGGPSAKIMLLGEQPGDQEDRQGEPFVGPAGAVLHKALDEAGIDDDEVYITNVVKHFRWKAGAKKRLHQKPARRHVMACRPWLDAELERVGPAVIVTLGSSASQTILGSHVLVTEDHGEVFEWEGHQVIPTIHPSASLRAPDSEERRRLRGILVDDLRAAKALAT